MWKLRNVAGRELGDGEVSASEEFVEQCEQPAEVVAVGDDRYIGIGHRSLTGRCGKFGNSDCVAGDFGECRDVQEDGRSAPGPLVELGQLVMGRGAAHAQTFSFAEPALLLSLVDALGEVVTDLLQPTTLSRVDPQNWATNAAVLVSTAGAPCSAAFAEGNLAALEMP